MGTSPSLHIRQSAADHYQNGQPIWSETDRWNVRKRAEISDFCKRWVPRITNDSSSILNAGAGSYRYEWMPPKTIHLDRFEAQASHFDNFSVGDIEDLPFQDSYFDTIICIGSVINYASAIETLEQFARTIKIGGHIILHFESSDSFEHILTSRWNKPTVPLRTINNGEPDIVWIFSRDFIFSNLRRLGFSILRTKSFHILSSALLRLGVGQQKAALAQHLDIIATPFSFFSDDVITVCKKE